MEALNSRLSSSTPKKPISPFSPIKPSASFSMGAAPSPAKAASPFSPIKPSASFSMGVAQSPAKAAPSDQIATPEKRIQPPRRARNRSMALSLKEVRSVALGLQRPAKEPSPRSDLVESEDDLVSLEEELVGRSTPKPLKAKPVVKLPEKYEMLVEFFNCMECSIRLLRLKGSMSTFPNICASIQHLTERRFTYRHLAQLKSILPESILIKKVQLRDEVTCCMKPELQVILQTGTIEDTVKQRDESEYSLMRRVFRERLVDFSNKHPEGDDIPEEALPHPFNQTNVSKSSSTSPKKEAVEKPAASMASVKPLSIAISHQQFSAPSHVSGSFRRRFSQKALVPDEKKTTLACLEKVSPSDDQSIKFSPRPPICKKPLLSSPFSLPLVRKLGPPENPMTSLKGGEHCQESNVLEGTPSKPAAATPARIMTCTPDIQTPKRHRPAMDFDSPQPKKLRRSAKTKLFMTPNKNEKTEDRQDESGCSSVDDKAISFLPESLLQSIREKERKAVEDKEAGVDEAIRRTKLLSCLHNIFDTILLIYQSGQRSLMTKQELVHKIIANRFKIVNRAEIEEQLELLLELVPDWISQKVASSGDTLICVNKMSNPEEIRQRLLEAK